MHSYQITCIYSYIYLCCYIWFYILFYILLYIYTRIHLFLYSYQINHPHSNVAHCNVSTKSNETIVVDMSVSISNTRQLSVKISLMNNTSHHRKTTNMSISLTSPCHRLYSSPPLSCQVVRSVPTLLPTPSSSTPLSQWHGWRCNGETQRTPFG